MSIELLQSLNSLNNQYQGMSPNVATQCLPGYLSVVTQITADSPQDAGIQKAGALALTIIFYIKENPTSNISFKDTFGITPPLPYSGFAWLGNIRQWFLQLFSVRSPPVSDVPLPFGVVTHHPITGPRQPILGITNNSGNDCWAIAFFQLLLQHPEFVDWVKKGDFTHGDFDGIDRDKAIKLLTTLKTCIEGYERDSGDNTLSVASVNISVIRSQLASVFNIATRGQQCAGEAFQRVLALLPKTTSNFSCWMVPIGENANQKNVSDLVRPPFGELPSTISLLLGRANEDLSKNRFEIIHPLDLNLSGRNYELVGACVHLGNRILFGHYITYRKVEGKWYRCDDASITEVCESTVLEACKRDSYLLVYRLQTS